MLVTRRSCKPSPSMSREPNGSSDPRYSQGKLHVLMGYVRPDC